MTQEIDIEPYEVEDDETDPRIFMPPPLPAARDLLVMGAQQGKIGATGIVTKPGHKPIPPLTDDGIDRSKWGSGPWDNEPDRDEWRIDAAPGVPLLALRHDVSGHWCGYVGVTEGHPWFGKTWNDNPLLGLEEWQPHGGVNYGAGCNGLICHVPRDGETDHVWWIGFSCDHFNDLSPWLRAVSRSLDDQRPCGRTADEIFASERYRTLDYVKAECERLAVIAYRAANGMEPLDPGEQVSL